jgi:prepilin-type N-terminal cleavage/methylation domain-containing protein
MNKKQKSLTNKGFSLVELIIVIAIMAVLIGVLAPQYLKYVERSRESSDLTNYQEIMSALQVYASDTTASIGYRNCCVCKGKRNNYNRRWCSCSINSCKYYPC